MSKLILIIAFLLSSIMLNAQKKQLSKRINNLSFNLLKNIGAEHDNVLFSAYSISYALGMTYLGAKDTTKLEMENVLFSQVNDVGNEFNSLTESISFNKKIELLSANALWIENAFSLEKTFKQSISETFNSVVNTSNFSNKLGRQKARKQINSWVEKNTKGKIPEFIAPRVLTESTTLVLVNAIYFYSKWHVKFKEQNTYEDVFKSNKNEDFKCNYITDTSFYSFYADDKLSAVEISYEDNEASMIILLPNDPSYKISNEVDNIYFQKIYSNLESEKVALHFPKFKLESDYELNKYLENLGLKSTFNASADFSGITGKKDIHISNVLHKAVIEVTETGTEASAATAIITSRSAVIGKDTEPTLFKADHPFAFLIIEKSTATILFMGTFDKPTKE